MAKRTKQGSGSATTVHVLLDTCVWLDLAGNDANEPLLGALETLCRDNVINMVVPQMVRDEFANNKDRVTRESGRSLVGVLRRARVAVWTHADKRKRRKAAAVLEDIEHKLNHSPDNTARAIAHRLPRRCGGFVNIGDPVEAGIVASLARPGGNTTGFVGGELSMGGKWLELLKEIAPQMNQVLVMTNPDSSNMGYLQVIENSARAVGVRVSSSAVRNAEEIESAINAIAQEANSGLIAVPGGPITVHRRSIFATTARHRLPAIYGFRYYAAEGGLISYGADVLDQWRRAASYVDRISKGERPANLPVQAPVKFELVINLKAAKALGITVPPTLLARAHEVIE